MLLGEALMANYRLYCLDGAGKISLANDIEAGDDAEAVVIARDTHRYSRMCEIWQRDRLVATLDAGDLASSAA